MNNIVKVYIITVLCSFGAKCMAYEKVYDLESSFICEVLMSVENSELDMRPKYKMVSYDNKSLDTSVVFEKVYSKKFKQIPMGQVILENSNEDLRYKATYTIYGTYALELENLHTGKTIQKAFAKDAPMISVSINEDSSESKLSLNCRTTQNIESSEVF